MEISKKDFFKKCERWRQHLATQGECEYTMQWGEAEYEREIANNPHFIEKLQEWYRDQVASENGGKKALYFRCDEELRQLFESSSHVVKADVVDAEIVENLPAITAETEPVKFGSELSRVGTYTQNNFHIYAPSKPESLPQFTPRERRKHPLVTDEYDIVALADDFQKRVPYAIYQKRVYLFLQTTEGDSESTAWVQQSHDELVGRLNWFYRRELAKIKTTKIVSELARFIETDLTHCIRELDEIKIRSRVQFLGRYYDLNRREWFKNTHFDFFTIYINARGIDVQMWNKQLVTYPKMMRNICRGDQKTFCAINEMLATCMSRTTEYKAAFFIGGPANSGKSALIHLIELFYPPAVKKHKSVQELQVEKELSELEGIALNTKEELSSTIFSPEETACFKQLTSGDGTEVTSAKKYCSDVTFKLTCHYIFATNLELRFSNYTQAVWNRVIYIGLEREIPSEQRIRNLNEHLRAELPGILQSLIPILQKLWNTGFQFTRNCEINSCVDKVIGESSNIRPLLTLTKVAGEQGSDVAKFANALLEPADKECKISMATVFATYTSWATDNGGELFGSQGMFTKELKKVLKEADFPNLYYAKASFKGEPNELSAVFGIKFCDNNTVQP